MIWTQRRACLKISPPRWYSRKELHTTWSLLLSCQAKRNTLWDNFLPEFLYDGHSVNCHFDINLTKSIQKCFFISALSIYYDRLIWRRQMDRKWLFAQPAPKCTLQLHAWKKARDQIQRRRQLNSTFKQAVKMFRRLQSLVIFSCLTSLGFF